MTSDLALVEQLTMAVDHVREQHAAQLAEWAALYVAAGRAIEAASRGDRAAALAHVEQAADAEYDLLGSCDAGFGRIENAGGPEGEEFEVPPTKE
jgi:hypothetical protein